MSFISFFVYCILGSVVVCFIGAILNDGNIYSTYSTEGCKTGVFSRSVPESAMCCSGYHVDDMICSAAYDIIERMLRKGSWVLPFFPLLIDVVVGIVSSRRWDFTPCFRRFLLYISIFLYRTVN